MSDERRTVRARIPFTNGRGELRLDHGEICFVGLSALRGFGIITDAELTVAIESRKAYKWDGDTAHASRTFARAAREIGYEVIP